MRDSLLEEGLIKLGLDVMLIQPQLARYVEEIELFNQAYGLVKVSNRRELIVKHVLDSLAPLSVMRNLLETSAGPEGNSAVRRIADAGSGAGLPGIPLAVCMPGAVFTLIERMGRRAGFLRDAVAVLALKNVLVKEAEMEKIKLSPEERFNLIVFRAFKPLEPAILKGLFSLLAPEGTLAAYKGRRKSIEEEMIFLKNKAAWEIIPLEVPFLEEERHLVLIRNNSHVNG